MKLSPIATFAGAFLLTLPAFAQDAAVGEKEFKKCKACHTIEAPDGTVVIKGGKTGPNLYGVVGRKAAAADGFKYSDALVKLAESGEIWTEEDLVAYITDPNKYVETKVGDPKLKTKMSFKLNKNQADVAAFLAANSPDAGTAPDAAPTDGADPAKAEAAPAG